MSLRSLLLDSTVENIRHSLHRHMPNSHQRDFYLWGLSAESSLQDTFLYAMSVTQLINLSAFLLKDLVEPEHWQKLAWYAGRLNAYFMYEIVSDDLAIGLSPLAVADPTYPLRREVLYTFNYVMVERLSGEPIHSAHLLEPVQGLSRSISGFTQSMTEEKHNFVLRSYLQHQPGVSPNDIEYAIWPVLVANIELCREITESMDRLHVGAMVRQGFIDRYRSSTQLLEARHELPLSELADIGTRSILVTATLAYFTGVLGEILDPQDDLAAIIDDGTLDDAVSTAALMVRLLNDVGVPLQLSPADRDLFIRALGHHYDMHMAQIDNIAQLLVSAAEDADFQARFNNAALLTRFHKDALAGEFNICLHNLAYTDSVEDGLAMLHENLGYFSQVYQQSEQHLQGVLGEISARLASPTIATLIWRFVQFYATLYGKPYKTSAGEYVA
jgi:hypothetical protein